MKLINNYIQEKLKLNKDVISKNIDNGITHTKFPKDKDELLEIIWDEFRENNYNFNMSLNHIDVSKINNLSDVFANSRFNGDISSWDVSNCDCMSRMFFKSDFNQDISHWKIKIGCNTANMFKFCDIEEKYKPFKAGVRL